MTLDVLYQFNEKYVPYAGASITSLLENNKHFQNIRIFILGEKLQSQSKARFRELAAKYSRQLTFVETDSLVALMKKMNMPTYRGSYAANMRLFLSFLLPEDVERVLYLDADTAVVGRLDELAELNMEGHPLAMCLDSLVRIHKKRLGFNREDYYYNSGVILFSMREWRKNRCSERIGNHVKNVRAWYPSPDQDLLNVVLKGEIMKLPPRFNIQPVYLAFSLRSYYRTFGRKGFYAPYEVREALSQPVIYHFFRFVGEFPWHRNNVHPDNDVFDKYLALSPWKDYIKQPAENGFILKFEKFLYKRIPRVLFIKLFRSAYERFIRKANSDSLKNKINRTM
ncbi:MAG: glycosyltransferase family 8 protein [Lachnospiraceae bacterium]|nr:glycosyltransferase family 8 protein [Lachnospiraceae bacterium]